MPNNPNEPDPKRAPDDPPAAGYDAPFGADSEEYDLANLPGESSFDGALPAVPGPTAPPDDATVSYDPPAAPPEAPSFASSVALGDLPPLQDGSDAELSGLIRSATPASGILMGEPVEVPPPDPFPEIPPPIDSTPSAEIQLGEMPELSDPGLSGMMPTVAPASDVLAGGSGSEILMGEPVSGVPVADEPALVESPAAAEPPAAADWVPDRATPGEQTVDTGRAEDGGQAEVDYGTLEPVAPASGWLDEDAPTEADADRPAARLDVTEAELFDAPAGGGPVEGSDIFAGRIEPARPPVESSDVIVATAFGAAPPEPDVTPPRPPRADRPSEVALSFDQPPGGSTIQEPGGSGDLPVADEAADHSGSSLFAHLPEEDSDGLFDSGELAATPPLPDPGPVEEPDYGGDPSFTTDASHILSDLTEPGEVTVADESSAVRLDAPGERSHPGHVPSSTEFDLSVGTDAVPPELAAAAAEAGEDSASWRKSGGSGLFDKDPTAPDLELAPKPAGPGGEDEADAAVEFTDHPTADDEAASSVFGPPTPKPGSAPVRRRTPADEVDFDLPEPPAAKAGPWESSTGEDEAVGFPHAVLGPPPGGPRRDKPAAPPADEGPSSGRPRRTSKLSATPSEESSVVSDPSMEIDWMSGSSTEEPITFKSDAPSEGPSRAEPKLRARSDRPTAAPARREPLEHEPEPGRKRDREPDEPRKRGGLLTGALLGLVVGGGGFAGAYFADLLPKSEKRVTTPAAQPGSPGPVAVNPPGVPQAAPAAPALADVLAAVRAGDPARAKQLAAAINDTSTAGKAAAGEAALYAVVQQQKGDGPVPADDPDLKAARDNLRAVVDDADAAKTPEGERAAVKAAVQIGLTYRLAGDAAAARKVYQDAIEKFPRYRGVFEANLTQLEPSGGQTRGLDRADAEALLFLLVLPQDPPAGANPATDETEAGIYFWQAVKAANAGEYAKAVEEIARAKAAHVRQAKALAGRGLNPLSDPLEQIFPKACDDLKGYWELRAAIYNNKAVAELFKKDGAAKALDELAAAQKKAADAVTLVTQLKDATTKLAEAGTKITAAEKAAKEAEREVEKVAKEAADKVAALKKDVEATDKLRLDVTKKLDATTAELRTAEQARVAAEKEAKEQVTLVAALAKELQAIKILPEKFDSAALLAAQKTAVERATGPNLGALLPAPAIAVGGGGLTAGQLVDISGRLTKAETAAKAATDKLATETQRLTGEHATELKKLKDDHATGVKKLTDDFAAKAKELMDTAATGTTKLKDEHAAELKKAADKYTLDLKKLTDENAAAAKKLADGYDGKLKDLEAAVRVERDRAEAMAAKFKADLGNAVSPAEALDLWLPLLTTLRRPADADGALAAASKVLAAAPGGTEDAAKAHTVAGLALLLKGDFAKAKAMFQQAKASPAYKAAAGKPWAKAVDVGLVSADDPLAPYRKPLDQPARDPAGAARLLDAGIAAYRAGRIADAASKLDAAVKADPTNALAWYFLGAVQWARGNTDAARDNFRQGAVHEAAGTTSGRTISAALAPIQGPARDALSAVRR